MGLGTSLAEVRRRLGPARILVRVTNLGLGFVLTTLVVAIGATNTGNNGLYILLALFLGTLIVSGFVSRRNVEGIRARLEGPEEVYAGEPVRFSVHLANSGRLPRNAVLVKVSGKAAPLLFGRIPRGGEAVRGIDLVFPRRGRHGVESLLLYSGYPIGLFRKGRLHPIGEERIVYPRPARPTDRRPEPAAGGDTADPRRRGRGIEVARLRDAVPGDDPRDIHWPQTARQGRLIVKERSSEEGREVLVVIEGARPAGAGPEWDARYEEAISEAAGLALRLLARGDRVGLLSGDTFIPPALGPAQRRAVLTALALATPGAPSPSVALPPGTALYRIRPAA